MTATRSCTAALVVTVVLGLVTQAAGEGLCQSSFVGERRPVFSDRVPVEKPSTASKASIDW